MRDRSTEAFDRLMNRYPVLQEVGADIHEACMLAVTALSGGHKFLACGNGGSAADAIHIVGELAKAYLLKRPIGATLRNAIAAGLPGPDASGLLKLEDAVPAIALTSNTALLTAIANDIGLEFVFAQQVNAFGASGDILLGLTTSGTSENVVRAFQVARALRMASVCLTGSSAPEWLDGLVDVVIRVPARSTPEVQELHLPIYHTLCEIVESELYEM